MRMTEAIHFLASDRITQDKIDLYSHFTPRPADWLTRTEIRASAKRAEKSVDKYGPTLPGM